MSNILLVAGSPAAAHCCQLLEDQVVQRLTAQGASVEQLAVRDLSILALMHHQVETPALVSALAQVARADAVVLTTPLYHGGYGGLLKLFLDVVLPLGLTGKLVLPLSSGASVLGHESTLRPVLVSLGARRILGGLSVPDRLLGARVEPVLETNLHAALHDLAVAARRGQGGVIDETAIRLGA